MHILKLLGRSVCASVFRISLFSLAIVMAIVMLFGTSTPLKQSLKASGIYDSLVPSILKNQQSQANKDPFASSVSPNGISASDPRIQIAARKALPPETLQREVETVVDSTYAWLQGKTTTPTFSIDLTQPKQVFIDSLAQSAADRAATLPVCSRAQLRAMAGSDIDYFNVDCRPPGVDAATISQQVAATLDKPDAFLGNTVITADSLQNNGSKNPFDNFRMLPRLYRLAMVLPWVLGGIVALSGAGFVLLHDQRRRGLYIISTTLITVGVLIGLISLLVDFLFNKLQSDKGPLSGLGGDALQQPVLKLVDQINHRLDMTLYLFAAAYIVLGAGIWVALRLTQPKTAAVPAATGKTKQGK